MASISPDWAETTVRWLRSKHPVYVPAGSTLTFNAQLFRALKKMRYLEYEMVEKRGFSPKRHLSTIEQSANEWTQPKHISLTKFLDAGGYVGLVAKAARSSSDKVKVAKTELDGSVAYEDLDLEVDELEAEVEKTPPKAQLSPTRELAEVLADASLVTDPRYGAW